MSMTMTDQSLTWASETDQVARGLTALGVAVPPDLIAAQHAYANAMGYHGPDLVDQGEVFNADPDTIEAIIDRAADAHLRRIAVGAVRSEFIARCAGRCRYVLNARSDEILGSLTKTFEKAAAVFEKAFARLPSHWSDSERLIKSVDDVQALHDAKLVLGTLDLCAEVRAALVPAPIGLVAIGSLYAKCSTLAVAEAAGTVRPSGSLGLWGNLLSSPGVDGLIWHPSAGAHQAYTASLSTPSVAPVLSLADQQNNRRADAEVAELDRQRAAR